MREKEQEIIEIYKRNIFPKLKVFEVERKVVFKYVCKFLVPFFVLVVVNIVMFICIVKLRLPENFGVVYLAFTFVLAILGYYVCLECKDKLCLFF